MLRFLDLANAVSLAALLSAAACCLLAISQRPAYAVVALIGAGLGDLFDGFVARRMKRMEEQVRFGARIDSLVDACSFGITPVILLYALGIRGSLDILLLGLFLVCAVWRLAYFDTIGMETAGGSGGPQYFIGLPTTYVALVLPLVFLTAFAGSVWCLNSLRVAAFVLALAMVSTVRVRKPGGLAYGFFLLLAVVVVGLLLWNAPLIQRTLVT